MEHDLIGFSVADMALKAADKLAAEELRHVSRLWHWSPDQAT